MNFDNLVLQTIEEAVVYRTLAGRVYDQFSQSTKETISMVFLAKSSRRGAYDDDCGRFLRSLDISKEMFDKQEGSR